MQVIKVFGKASQTARNFEVTASEEEENLLQWLRLKGVTIASSCDGKGVCRKCIIQQDFTTCEMTVRSFLDLFPDGIIFVDYL
jgi:ferredoxin